MPGRAKVVAGGEGLTPPKILPVAYLGTGVEFSHAVKGNFGPFWVGNRMAHCHCPHCIKIQDFLDRFSQPWVIFGHLWPVAAHQNAKLGSNL